MDLESDPGWEAVNVRISFIRFGGFSVSGTLPDRSRICRFRRMPAPTGTQSLRGARTEEINRQLEEQGILVRESNGAIVDATIIAICRRPRKVIEIMPEQTGKAIAVASCSDEA